jgi:hypothetical protein
MANKYIDTNQDVAGFENLTKFDSFYVNRYVDGFVTGFSFVFVTKPSLFIYPYKKIEIQNAPDINLAYQNMTKDQFFSQFIITESMNKNDRTIVEQLSYYQGVFPTEYDRSNFLPIFTNKARGFTTTDVNMEQQEAYVTKQGYKMPIPTYKTVSEASSTVAIPTFETPNLDIMKTLSIWVNYISNVTDGTFHANPIMVKNGVIDYMSSIYYFVLEPDGKTLKYWAKYTGCWPNVIPMSQMSFRKGESNMVEVEANFIYTSKEDMNVAVLEDFNRVSLGLISTNREQDLTEDYISGKKSAFLSKEGILANPNYYPDFRGPLIFYNPGSPETANGTPTNEKFELTFGERVYESTFVKDTFNSDYFFKQEDFFKSDLDKEE